MVDRITKRYKFNRSGSLIVLEGPDNVGKTSLATALMQHFQQTEQSVIYYPFPGKDERTLGGLVYDIHHNSGNYMDSLDARSLQLLHISAHVDAIGRVLNPALKQGWTVLLDRYWWSTYVYGILFGADITFLEKAIEVEKAAWLKAPDLAVLVLRDNHERNPDDLADYNELRRIYLGLQAEEMNDYPCIVHDNSIDFRDSVIGLASEIHTATNLKKLTKVSQTYR